jgi:hypothetical protein
MLRCACVTLLIVRTIVQRPRNRPRKPGEKDPGYEVATKPRDRGALQEKNLTRPWLVKSALVTEVKTYLALIPLG